MESTTCTPGAADSNSATDGIVAVTADHLIMNVIHVHLMLRELGMPPRYSRRRISNQQHTYVSVGRHDRGDVPALSNDPPDRVGDQLLLAARPDLHERPGWWQWR